MGRAPVPRGADPAANTVAELLDAERPLMSWMNLGEVLYILRLTHAEDARHRDHPLARDATVPGRWAGHRSDL